MPTIAKKCFNRCPNCNAGSDLIDWGEKEWHDTSCAQDATCKKCGIEFKEYYNYAGSEFEGEEKIV